MWRLHVLHDNSRWNIFRLLCNDVHVMVFIALESRSVWGELIKVVGTFLACPFPHPPYYDMLFWKKSQHTIPVVVTKASRFPNFLCKSSPSRMM